MVIKLHIDICDHITHPSAVSGFITQLITETEPSLFGFLRWRHYCAYPFRVNSTFLLVRPPVRSNGRTYKMLVMFFFRHAFSEFPRPIALKLCNLIGICVCLIMQVQKLGGTPLKKSEGQKHAKFRSVLDHFRLWSRISPERLKISKIGRRYKLWQFLLRLTKKVRWTLVH